MNGPQHYKAAEALLHMATELGGDREACHLAAAQVHATLAATAALIDTAASTYEAEWAEVTE